MPLTLENDEHEIFEDNKNSSNEVVCLLFNSII